VKANRGRLGFIGPMLGRHGRVPSQGEILASLLAAEGYEIRGASSVVNPIGRLLDTCWSIARWGGHVDAIVLSVFSGRGFLIAEVASTLTRWRRRPLVLWLHGGALPGFAARHPQRVARLLRRGAAVVCPSPYLAQELHHDTPTRVIPNVLRLDRYEFRPRRVVQSRLLWMRAFDAEYRPELAVEAVAGLRAAGVDATVTMAGQPGEALEPTRALARRLGVEEAVTFFGFADAEAKIQLFESHDIYLHTNAVDNMPVTILEAVACGLPVVGMAVGGIPYLLTDGETALLVDDGDVAGLVRGVQRLLADPELAAALSAAGRQLAERSAWPAVRSAWEGLLADLMTAGARPAKERSAGHGY
jgi:glycosyltransferase involved in cell wall biosynthesis